MGTGNRPSAARVRGEVRVDGLLRLAPDTLYEADVHAPGGLVARSGSIVAGDVYTDGPVQLAATARIGGRVLPTGTGTWGEAGGGGGTLRRRLQQLLELTAAGDLSDRDVEHVLERLGERPSPSATDGDWSPRAVREVLYGRGLARLAPVTIEDEAGEAFLLRIRRGTAGEAAGTDPDAVALVELARRLGERARPELNLHVLSSARTPGDVVLLVDA